MRMTAVKSCPAKPPVWWLRGAASNDVNFKELAARGPPWEEAILAVSQPSKMQDIGCASTKRKEGRRCQGRSRSRSKTLHGSSKLVGAAEQNGRKKTLRLSVSSDERSREKLRPPADAPLPPERPTVSAEVTGNTSTASPNAKDAQRRETRESLSKLLKAKEKELLRLTLEAKAKQLAALRARVNEKKVTAPAPVGKVQPRSVLQPKAPPASAPPTVSLPPSSTVERTKSRPAFTSAAPSPPSSLSPSSSRSNSASADVPSHAVAHRGAHMHNQQRQATQSGHVVLERAARTRTQDKSDANVDQKRAAVASAPRNAPVQIVDSEDSSEDEDEEEEESLAARGGQCSSDGSSDAEAHCGPQQREARIRHGGTAPPPLLREPPPTRRRGTDPTDPALVSPRSRSRSLSLGGASDDSEVQRRWRMEEAAWRHLHAATPGSMPKASPHRQ